MNLLIKQKENHRHREQTYCCLEEGWGEGTVREFGIDMHTPLCLKWLTNKELLYSTWDSAQCLVVVWMVDKFGEEWIRVYVWLGPFPVHLKLSEHCLSFGYTAIQNKK